jgi:hypothetical protein
MIIGEQDQTGGTGQNRPRLMEQDRTGTGRNKTRLGEQEKAEQDQTGKQDNRITGPDWWNRTRQKEQEVTEQDQACETGEGVTYQKRAGFGEPNFGNGRESFNRKMLQ